MALFRHYTIADLSAKALISALSYYNSKISDKKTITFTKFVERCVSENPTTHHLVIHFNNNTNSELSKFGFVDNDGNIMTQQQADFSFNVEVMLYHSFYYLFEYEEEQVLQVLNKANKSIDN